MDIPFNHSRMEGVLQRENILSFLGLACVSGFLVL
jgi:hypothetical protein